MTTTTQIRVPIQPKLFAFVLTLILSNYLLQSCNYFKQQKEMNYRISQLQYNRTLHINFLPYISVMPGTLDCRSVLSECDMITNIHDVNHEYLAKTFDDHIIYMQSHHVPLSDNSGDLVDLFIVYRNSAQGGSRGTLVFNDMSFSLGRPAADIKNRNDLLIKNKTVDSLDVIFLYPKSFKDTKKYRKDNAEPHNVAVIGIKKDKIEFIGVAQGAGVYKRSATNTQVLQELELTERLQELVTFIETVSEIIAKGEHI